MDGWVDGWIDGQMVGWMLAHLPHSLLTEGQVDTHDAVGVW